MEVKMEVKMDNGKCVYSILYYRPARRALLPASNAGLTPVSKKHPQMSMYHRAAQFAPFAALVGHDKAIEETAKQNVESFTDK